MRSDLAYEIRPYRREDEANVLDLLRDALGPGPVGELTAPFFRWKHEDGPFGPSHMLVAEVDGRIAGLRAFMRWGFRAGSDEFRAVTAVDTATHPDFQGLGIFSKLTRTALEELRGDTDLVFNTPNEKSLPGYLKMGWEIVGRVPVRVRVRRPVRFARGARALRDPEATPGRPPAVRAEAAAEALAHPGLPGLLAAAGRDERIATRRDPEYLRWRYASPPGLEYHAVRVGRSGRPAGLGIFRVRPRGPLWEATVVETITAAGDVAAAREVLRRVARSAAVDHLTCHFPTGTAAGRASRTAGYLPAPGGVTFVVRPLRDGLRPDPRAMGSWALTLGDVEVF
jgi:GNAT superfamily N-acetyltransferase